MYVKGFRQLFEFAGYVVESVATDGEEMQARLRPDRRLKPSCSDCGRRLVRQKSRCQEAWDLPFGIATFTRLVYEAVQWFCPACGKYSTLHPEGIDDQARSTRRLMEFVHWLCRFMPVDDVPLVVPVPAQTARRWDKKMLEEELPPPKLDGLRILLIDEKHLGRRLKYVTLVMNGENSELLYAAPGKKKESLEGFMKALTEAQRASIEAVAVDRAGAYTAVIREYLPHARIVYDKFHVLGNFHQLMDKVRRQEWRQASQEDKDVIKGQRYNLFRNKENLKPEQEKDLNALLAMNANLSTLYVLRDAFKLLWNYTRPGWAKKYFDKWISWALEADMPLLTTFANNLQDAMDEILNYCIFPITTGRLEAFNATINRIIYRACGVSDVRYLFLKLRQHSLHL